MYPSLGIILQETFHFQLLAPAILWNAGGKPDHWEIFCPAAVVDHSPSVGIYGDNLNVNDIVRFSDGTTAMVTNVPVITSSDTQNTITVRAIDALTQVLVAGDVGKTVYISTGGVTINQNVFSSGDLVTIINNSGSTQTITQGSSFTLYNTTDAATGNKTLNARGICTVWFADHNVGYISGNFA